MTLTQIEYLLAVAKEKNFRKAAKYCHVTQPTLSAQIQKLEAEFGITIFNRAAFPVTLTRMGQAIVEQAKIAYCEIKKISETVEVEKGILAGELNIGVIPTISPYLIPRFIGSFGQNFPDLTLNVSEMTTSRCLEALDNETIDAAILGTQESSKLYSQEKLFDEPLLLFINPQHPLAKKSRIKPVDLDINHMWLLEEGHCLRDDVIEVCRLHPNLKKKPGNLRIKVGNLESIRFLVQEQFGYTLLPYLATLKLSHSEKPLLRKFHGEQPSRTIYLTRKKQYLKSAAINALKLEIQGSV